MYGAQYGTHSVLLHSGIRGQRIGKTMNKILHGVFTYIKKKNQRQKEITVNRIQGKRKREARDKKNVRESESTVELNLIPSLQTQGRYLTTFCNNNNYYNNLVYKLASHAVVFRGLVLPCSLHPSLQGEG